MHESGSISLIKKTQYAKKLGIWVDYFNISPVLTDTYPTEHQKPFYSILLDDRSGLQSAYFILKTTLKELNLWNHA